MRFRYLLFDLDGTLSASGPGITKSAQYALHRMGIEEPDASRLTFFVGPPLNLTFRERYGMNEQETARAIAFFRERYDTKGVFENELYPGIAAMLQRLEESGRRLAIASSKPENLVHRVLEHFGVASYFSVIVGSDPAMESENKASADNKQQMVRKALEGLRNLWVSEEPSGTVNGTADAEEFLQSCAMVGDRCYDIKGAKANRVAAIGVTYGYGTREELESAGADAIAGSVGELEELLMAQDRCNRQKEMPGGKR